MSDSQIRCSFGQIQIFGFVQNSRIHSGPNQIRSVPHPSLDHHSHQKFDIRMRFHVFEIAGLQLLKRSENWPVWEVGPFMIRIAEDLEIFESFERFLKRGRGQIAAVSTNVIRFLIKNFYTGRTKSKN